MGIRFLLPDQAENARHLPELVVDQRYEGIPGVSLGGYVAGLAAQASIPRPSSRYQRLSLPDRAGGDGCFISTRNHGSRVDHARRGRAGSEHYPGFTHSFFPNCFTCGPKRSPGDGLRIFPGPVEARPVVASLWEPPSSVWKADRTVASEFLWAALDCPAIWGQIVHGGAQAGDRGVTGRQELHQHEPIRGDATSIVVGWPLERQGGKIIAGAAIFSESGQLLVEARQTMIATVTGGLCV
jgi:hypothetical protein